MSNIKGQTDFVDTPQQFTATVGTSGVQIITEDVNIVEINKVRIHPIVEGSKKAFHNAHGYSLCSVTQLAVPSPSSFPDALPP